MNNTPRITQLNIHDVTPDDVKVVVTVFPNFGSIDIVIGKMSFQMFCKDTAEAHAIAEKLGYYTVNNSAQQDAFIAEQQDSFNEVVYA